jgi:1-acyl-sn-glycerol-3-phosphate acyltransferase
LQALRSIIATVLFVLVTIVLSIVSIPAALIDRSGRSYLWLARTWSQIFLWLYGIKVRVEGIEKVKPDEHYVFVSNHASYTDIPVVLASVPAQIRIILRHELTRVPIWGWALLTSPFLIVDRSNASKARETLSKAAETIKAGASVLLFPEGTRTHDGNLQEFKRGAFKLAFDSQTTILPIALDGTFTALPRTEKLPRAGSQVVVRIGEPIPFVVDPNIPTRTQEIALMKQSEEQVRAMLTRKS